MSVVGSDLGDAVKAGAGPADEVAAAAAADMTTFFAVHLLR